MRSRETLGLRLGLLLEIGGPTGPRSATVVGTFAKRHRCLKDHFVARLLGPTAPGAAADQFEFSDHLRPARQVSGIAFKVLDLSGEVFLGLIALGVPIEECCVAHDMGVPGACCIQFMPALVTIEAAAQSEFGAQGAVDGNSADPYMTAMCYFNALRELGDARRIVEDEVRYRAQPYGTERRRIIPAEFPFANSKTPDALVSAPSPLAWFLPSPVCMRGGRSAAFR